MIILNLTSLKNIGSQLLKGNFRGCSFWLLAFKLLDKLGQTVSIVLDNLSPLVYSFFFVCNIFKSCEMTRGIKNS